MIDSNIQWTDHTWNIARGCTKVDDDCKFCYMYRGSLDSKRYNPMAVTKTKTVFNLPLKIKPGKSNVWDGPQLVFTSSLTDVFHSDIDQFRNEMWEIIKARQDLTFQLLTKRPERISNSTLYYEKTESGGIFHRNMKNVWLGTSVGHPGAKQRIVDLVHSMWRGIKFLSLEPLHQKIDFDFITCPNCGNSLLDHGIDWVIVGGESGNENGKYRYRECQLEWIELIISQCLASDVPVFVKQLGTHLSKKLGLVDRHGGDWNEWPAHLRIRQFPRV